MKRREQEFFSVEGEPAFSGKADLELDPAERKVVRQEELERRQTVAEIDALRDSVLSEPSLDAGTAAELGADRADFGDWLAVRKLRVGMGSLVLVTLLAGLAGGPFAIVGALMKSGLGGINIILWASYAIVLGPLIEEMLKQSGALFLLERRPYWLKHGWQFPVIAVVSAGLFATIENVMYINGPIQELEGDAYASAVSFRWRYCTLLHVGCSLIASVGMWKIWRRQLEDETPAQLGVGYPWVVAAVVCHGAYNLAASTLIKFGD